MNDTSKKKAQTVADDMRQRRCFYPTGESLALPAAQAYLAKCIEDFADFGDFPFIAPGVSTDEEGNTVFSEAVYSDSVGVMVGVLKRQGEGVLCLFMAPIPDFPAMLAAADESAAPWALGILEKEANHVAVRHLRNAKSDSELEDAREQMPHSVDAYTNSARGQSSGIMESFNELYKAISAAIGGKVGAWSRARLNKSDLKRAFESRPYALEYYSALEDRGESPSLFVIGLDMGIQAAKKKGLDPTIFERWKATRDEKPFKPDESEDEDFDMDSLTGALLEELADAPATESGSEPTGEEPAA